LNDHGCVFFLKEDKQRLNLMLASSSNEIKGLAEENNRLCVLVERSSIQKQVMLDMQTQAAESFARTIQSMATGQGSANKRARPADDDEVERQEGIDRYTSGLIELRDAEHMKAVKAIKAEHCKEVECLRAKAAEPINEFRISKQFHNREAELKKEVQKVQYALGEEKKKSLAVDWDVREKTYMKRDLAEMKKRCADRDQLFARIALLEGKVQKYEDRDSEGDPRTESEEQLLERVKALMVRW
jgi:hypothetical protein